MMGAKEQMMNKAAGDIHKSGGDKREKPAADRKGMGGAVGEETKADMRGALDGNPTDKNPLRAGVKELHKQHDIAYDDLGPHHKKMADRHEPVGKVYR